MDRAKLIEYLRAHAEIRLTAEQDDIPVRGNVMASGDDEADRAAEDEILDRLDRGDVWAWACVQVRALLRRYEGSDFLGAVSLSEERACHKSEEAFRSDATGYYKDMVEAALEALADDILGHEAELAELRAAVGARQECYECGNSPAPYELEGLTFCNHACALRHHGDPYEGKGAHECGIVSTPTIRARCAECGTVLQDPSRRYCSTACAAQHHGEDSDGPTD